MELPAFKKGSKEDARKSGQSLASVFDEEQLKIMRRNAALTFMYALLEAKKKRRRSSQ